VNSAALDVEIYTGIGDTVTEALGDSAQFDYRAIWSLIQGYE
jgi:hypothetical protein